MLFPEMNLEGCDGLRAPVPGRPVLLFPARGKGVTSIRPLEALDPPWRAPGKALQAKAEGSGTIPVGESGLCNFTALTLARVCFEVVINPLSCFLVSRPIRLQFQFDC